MQIFCSPGGSCSHSVACGALAAILPPGGACAIILLLECGGHLQLCCACPLQRYSLRILPRMHRVHQVLSDSVAAHCGGGGGGACSRSADWSAPRVFLAWYVFSGVRPSDSVCIPSFMAAPFQVDTQFCQEMNGIFQVTYVQSYYVHMCLDYGTIQLHSADTYTLGCRWSRLAHTLHVLLMRMYCVCSYAY